MRAAVVVALLAGCIREPAFETCGDLLCPDGTQCVMATSGPACVAPDTVAQCAGKTEGDACVAQNEDGHCADGLCVRNVCGDGVATGVELCDGDDVRTTCAQLGFYSGTPTCTSQCIVTPDDGCAGTCGDDIVDTAAGEQCDNSIPTDSCVGYGRDWGTVTCNDTFCAPNIVEDCHRFGWQPIVTTLHRAIDGAYTAQGYAAVDGTTLTWSSGGATGTLDGSFTRVLATTTGFVAIGPTDLARTTDGTTWTHRTDAGVADTQPVALDPDTGTVYTVTPSCAVSALGAEDATLDRSFVASPLTTCTAIAWVEDLGLFIATATPQGTQVGIYHFDGTGWTPVEGSLGTIVLASGLPKVLSAADYAYDFTGGTVVLRRHGRHFKPFVVTRDGDELDTNLVPRFDVMQNNLVFLYPAGVEEAHATLGGDGTAGIATATGLYRLGPMSGFQLTTDTNVNAIAILDTGAIATCGAALTVHAYGGYRSTSSMCRAFVGDPREDYVYSASSSILAGTNYSDAITLYGTAAIMLAGTPAHVLAMTATGTLYQRAGNGMTPLATPGPSGCHSIAIAGSTDDTITSVWSCTNGTLEIDRLTAGAWVPLVTGLPPTGFQEPLTFGVAPDGTVFISIDQLYRIDGATAVPIGPAATRMVARSATDLYYRTADRASLQHWTGARTVEITQVDGPFAVSDRQIVTLEAGTGTLRGIARMPALVGPTGP